MKTKKSDSEKSHGQPASNLKARTPNSKDLYQKYTDLIIDRLEQGFVPWRQPWTELGLPSNYLTKKPYRGINLWILLSYNHQIPYYLTFRQVQGIGGKIKKGAKAIPICFWNFVYRDDETGAIIPKEHITSYPKERLNRRGYLKEYKVFPLEQIEGVDWDLPNHIKNEGFDPRENCEQILSEMAFPPKLKHGEAQAYYYSPTDTINLPQRKLFPAAEEYYTTLFHELVHATGHVSRLNRSGITIPNKHDSKEYAKEELVAELGAGYLSNLSGIAEDRVVNNSAAYLRYWITRLQNDKSLLVEAAGQAQKAVDFILMKCPF